MIPSLSPVQPATAVAPMPGAVGDAAAFAALFAGGGDPGGAPATGVPDKAPASERQDDAGDGSTLPDATIDPAWLAMILGGAPATNGAATAPAGAASSTPPVSLEVARAGRGVVSPDIGLVRSTASPPSPTAWGVPEAVTDTSTASSDEVSLSDIQVQAALPDHANVPDPWVDEASPRSGPTLAHQFVPAASPSVIPFVATPPTTGAIIAASPVAFRGAPAPARSPVAPAIPRISSGAPVRSDNVASAAIPSAITSDVSAPVPPSIAMADMPAQDRAAWPTAVPGRTPPAGVEPRQPVATSAPPTATPMAPMLATGTVASAGELFATAIHTAARRQPDDARADPLSPSPFTMGAAAPIAAATSAGGGGADPSLDMRHGNWPSAMIDHIEKLRDAADAVDTRIRVVPDALGGIDVSLRRHDDGVEVTLRADQSATQAMLAEARPQLTAMAEARGIRLADAGVSGNMGGSTGGDDASGAGGRQPSPMFTPATPARALSTTDTDPADGRVA